MATRTLFLYLWSLYHLNPTSNHNLSSNTERPAPVVYHLNPTSNHNCSWGLVVIGWLYIILILHQTTTWPTSYILHRPLYIILILHQTTTPSCDSASGKRLYIILILHQTTTVRGGGVGDGQLYIILILHQTTTFSLLTIHHCRCISS